MLHLDLNHQPSRKAAVLLGIAGGWTSNLVFIAKGVLMIPLYLAHLGDRLYGFWLASGGVLAWLAMVDIGVAAMTQQRCGAAYAKRDLATVKTYFWHGAVVIATIVALFALLVFAISRFVPTILQVDPEYQSVIVSTFLVAAIGTALQISNEFLVYFADSLQRSAVHAASQVLGDVLSLIAMLVGLVVLDWGIWAIAIGLIIGPGVPFLVNSFYTALLLRSAPQPFRFSRSILRDYLVTTPSILASKGSLTFLSQLAPVFLTRLFGPEATVAYSTGLRVLSLFENVINRLAAGIYAACSHFFQDTSVSPSKKRATLNQMIRVLTVPAALGGILYAILNQGFLHLWIPGTPFAGQLFVCLSALASFLVLLNNLYVGFGVALGKIRQFENAHTVKHVLCALLMVAAIPVFGFSGAPLAIIASGLALQPFMLRMLDRADAEVGAACRPTLWYSLPLAACLVLAYPLSGLFVTEGWFRFLAGSALLGIPFAAVLLLALPEVRSRVATLPALLPLRLGFRSS